MTQEDRHHEIIVQAAEMTERVYPDDAWEILNYRLTESRKAKMLQAVKQRSKKLRLVLQDVHLTHNVSACLRSAEAFGLVDLDVINLKKSFKPSPVSRGVEKWLDIRRYTDVASCATTLRNEGYKIAVAYPNQNAISVNDLPLDENIAVVFGNEHDGVSYEWKSSYDYAFYVPMVGFVESLNISVSVAVALYHLRYRWEKKLGADFLLSESEQKAMLNKWVCREYLETYEREIRTSRNKF